jgi:hypothetical protein
VWHANVPPIIARPAHIAKARRSSDTVALDLMKLRQTKPGTSRSFEVRFDSHWAATRNSTNRK